MHIHIDILHTHAALPYLSQALHSGGQRIHLWLYLVHRVSTTGMNIMATTSLDTLTVYPARQHVRSCVHRTQTAASSHGTAFIAAAI